MRASRNLAKACWVSVHSACAFHLGDGGLKSVSHFNRIITYRSVSFCVEVISSVLVFRKQRTALRFNMILLKWRTAGLIPRACICLVIIILPYLHVSRVIFSVCLLEGRRVKNVAFVQYSVFLNGSLGNFNV